MHKSFLYDKKTHKFQFAHEEKKRTLTRVKSSEGETIVELEGIEPSSKQGRPVLSTRLSRPGFSSAGKTRATNQHLIS